ncbi:MAG: carbonic anhydrase [Planctomycetes bacterium]|nr:carbonic anhydrase [Planctomycetota bacterium]
MNSAGAVLKRLKEGNKRYVEGKRCSSTAPSNERRNELVNGQNPFAVILGCSDSRVPVELIFDQGLGDLFVIRIAGNIVAPSIIDSIEFAAEAFDTHLVVVLGHSDCGAVKTAIKELMMPAEQQSRCLHSFVERVRASIEPLLITDLRNNPEELEEHAIRANILSSANQIRHGSEIIETLVREKKLKIVGAEYSLETGAVDFFDLEG